MEPTLAIAYKELKGDVGFYLGYGRGADFDSANPWSDEESLTVDSLVRSGLRQFYYPPPEYPGSLPYDWSFLRPIFSTTLVANAAFLDMPDDFGGIEGRITVTGTTVNVIPWAVDLTNEGIIREAYAASPSCTGRPLRAAVVPLKGTTLTEGQRHQLYVYPLPDQAYPLQFAYYLNPNYLSGAKPYAYGGPQHAETLLESCLAIAEERLQDIAGGPHAMKFKERLLASIGADSRLKPQLQGYNGDASDNVGWTRRDQYDGSRTTVYGVQY